MPVRCCQRCGIEPSEEKLYQVQGERARRIGLKGRKYVCADCYDLAGGVKRGRRMSHVYVAHPTLLVPCKRKKITKISSHFLSFQQSWPSSKLRLNGSL